MIPEPCFFEGNHPFLMRGGINKGNTIITPTIWIPRKRIYLTVVKTSLS